MATIEMKHYTFIFLLTFLTFCIIYFTYGGEGENRTLVETIMENGLKNKACTVKYSYKIENWEKKGDFEYGFINELMTRENAADVCKSYNSRLLIILLCK